MKSSTHEGIVEVKEVSASSDDNEKGTQQPTPVAPVAAWPSEPLTLIPDTSTALFALLFDIVLLVVPVLLIIKILLVIIAWHMDHRFIGTDIDLVSPLTTYLVRVNGQLVTLFTIIFATVVSTLVRRFALYKAQNGAFIGELEQLQGSISLPSTLKLVWSLRAFTATSISLISIWSFYYLGSQAAKAEYKAVNSGSYSKQIAAVVGPFAHSSLDTLLNINSLYKPINRNLYDAMNIKDDKVVTGRDWQNNPRVPDLVSIINGSESNDYKPLEKIGKHGWVKISPNTTHQASYPSYVGNIILTSHPPDETINFTYGMPAQVVGKYSYNTSYLNFKCSEVEYLNLTAFPSGLLVNQTVSLNMTTVDQSAPQDKYGNILRSFDVWTSFPNGTSDADGNDLGPVTSRYTCNVTRTFVEIEIGCVAAGCTAKKMRYSNGTGLQNATTYSTPFDNSTFADVFFSNMLLSDGIQTDALYPRGFAGDIKYDVGFSPEIMADLLTLYINTYYQLSLPLQLGEGILPDFDAIIQNGTDGNYIAANLNGAVYAPQYAISWFWITMDFFSCIVLLKAAIISAWLRSRTIAPDILGCVSSLTRDNPHLRLPNNGTTMNGLQRARMLKNVKVKIGDVSRDTEDLGRVGIARIDSADFNGRVAPLKSDVKFV